MSDHVDNWHKLASYNTNLQAELFANLLKNNGINVSVQALSPIPGMNSGSVLWVQTDDLTAAKQLLNNAQKDSEHHLDDGNGFDNE